MSQERLKQSGGRTAVGVLLGAILALATPFAFIAEVSSLMPLVFINTIGLVLLSVYFGRTVTAISLMLQLAFIGIFFGNALMALMLFAGLLPCVYVLRGMAQGQAFFTQLRRGLIAFGIGMLAALMLTYAIYGANMIERFFTAIPDAVRTLPQEYLKSAMDMLSRIYGQTLDVEGFYRLFDDMIAKAIPLYQLYLPGVLFSGAIINAVICVGVGNWARAQQGMAAEGSYVPLGEWTLPGSTTYGLLLVTAVSYILFAAGMRNGESVFNTILDIAVWAFCIQALASVNRRLAATPLKAGIRRVLLVVLMLIAYLGFSAYVAIYGCISAIFGRRGALKQRIERNDGERHDDSE